MPSTNMVNGFHYGHTPKLERLSIMQETAATCTNLSSHLFLLLVFCNDLLRGGFANQISSSLGVSANKMEKSVRTEHDRFRFNRLIIPHT